jgi:hypothetical protein
MVTLVSPLKHKCDSLAVRCVLAISGRSRQPHTEQGTQFVYLWHDVRAATGCGSLNLLGYHVSV